MRSRMAKKSSDRSEFKEALAKLAALEDFGFEQDFARGCGKDETLADGDFAAGTDKGAPEVCLACSGQAR